MVMMMMMAAGIREWLKVIKLPLNPHLSIHSCYWNHHFDPTWFLVSTFFLPHSTAFFNQISTIFSITWIRPGFVTILKTTNCKRTTMMNSIMGLRELSSTRITKYRTEIFVLVQLATQTKLLIMFLISSTCRMRFWEQIFVAPNVWQQQSGTSYHTYL